MLAARRKGTAASQVSQVGDFAFDIDFFGFQPARRVWHRCQQHLCIGMFGVGDEFFGFSLFDDEAGVHHHNFVGEITRARQIVGDIQKTNPLPVAQFGHQVEDAQTNRDVQHRHRLICQDHIRFNGQRAGDSNPLTLPAA